MKIALVNDWLTGYGGQEAVILAIRELYPEAPVFTSVYNQEVLPQYKDVKVITSILQEVPGAKKHRSLFTPFIPMAFESLDLKGYDVVFSNGAFAKGVITHPNQKHLNYCHTPIRYIWNLGGDDRTNGWLKSRIVHSLRIWDVVSANRVDQFYGNSQNVVNRIAKIYRKPAKILYPPVEIEKYSAVKRNPKDFFVTIGRLVGYKRVNIAVEACIASKMSLKVVGEGAELAALKKLAIKAPWIEFTGYIPEAEIASILSEARAFLFPAEEDFGIAPVEAMSVGCPVIAYAKGGALETVKDGVGGEFFQEQSVASLLEKLRDFKDDYIPEKVKASVSHFSKERFLSEVKGIVEGSI